jgi:Icc-related predicted phosphoesterase
MPPARVVADVLVVAGDAANGDLRPLLRWCSAYVRHGRPVVFVPGNHEYYGTQHALQLRLLQRQARAGGVRLLHNAAVRYGHVEIFGTTLWTDFALEGAAGVACAQAVARRSLADYVCIYEAPQRLLRPETTVRWHRKAKRLLEQFLQSNTATVKVVVTHHAPAPGSVHKQFVGYPLNPAFVSDLTALMRTRGPALWVHGHTHRSVDYLVGATRVLANPRGYGRRLVLPTPDGPVTACQNENLAFDPTFVVEV